MLTLTGGAQTLNVKTGQVTYRFAAADTGDMTYSEGGATVTIQGKVFAVADIETINVDATEVTPNLVSVSYDGTTTAVSVAGNVAQYVTPGVSGAHVTLVQSNTDAVDGDEIIYQLSGTTTDGEFALEGAYKCTVSLAGLTLTNPSGAAININNKKRIQLSAKKGTENTLADGSGGSQKGCIYSKGQLQLQGNGTLNVAGNTAHAVKSGDYISVKNLTLNITGAVKDGISCNGYFQMTGGTVSISGVGDDGIQCDLDGTASTGETTGHEDEDSGNIYLEGGTLGITATAAATKGIKAAGDIRMTDGTVNVSASGTAAWDTDDLEIKGSACLSADGNTAFSGGTATLTNTGAGGKGIKSDGTLSISGEASLSVTAGGQIAYCSSSSNTTVRTTTSSSATERLSDNLSVSPKAVKSTGAMSISGGSLYAKSAYHEGIETKSTLDITNGYVYAEAGDDAVNASGDVTVSGGYLYGNSTGNDGLDANGNFYIKGGNVVAVAARAPEVGIDANTEGGKQLYITGGNVVAIGGFESGASISGGTAKSASSYTKGAWYGLYNGSTAAFAFKIPSNSSMGSTMAVYTTGTPALSKSVTTGGTAFWNGYGYSTFSGGSSVTLSNYNSGGGGGGGGFPGGGGGRW